MSRIILALAMVTSLVLIGDAQAQSLHYPTAPVRVAANTQPQTVAQVAPQQPQGVPIYGYSYGRIGTAPPPSGYYIAPGTPFLAPARGLFGRQIPWRLRWYRVPYSVYVPR